MNVMLIDKNKNSIILELDDYTFKHLNIDSSKIKNHKTRKELNVEVSEFFKAEGD